jgi:predicted nucleic acid-binding protein
MNAAIDTSVIIAVLTNEKKKYRLLEITQGKNLLAPFLLQNEVLQTLLQMKKRQWIRDNQLLEALEIFQKIPIRYVDIPLPEIAELALEQRISSNDAAYLLTSKKFRALLLTLDHTLKIAAGKLKISVWEE